jgi:CRP-like cAMP-binding protein
MHLLAWHDVETRLERRLADLAARFGHEAPDGVAIGLRLSQDELAAMIGCTRESANRALGRIVAAGRVAVVRRGRYVVRSPLRAVVPDDGPSAAPPSCSIVSMHELQ